VVGTPLGIWHDYSCFLCAKQAILWHEKAENTMNKQQKLINKSSLAITDAKEDTELPGSLDKFDIHILNQLQADGRLTNAELANRVGLSPAPCWRRVRRLETEGYISGYHAAINRHKVGLGVIAFVRIFADRNTGEVTRELKEQLIKLPEVMSCHHISGEGSFEITVMATDLEAYSRFAMQTLINLPHVKDLHTSFSLGEVKASHELPLGHLQR
jgi:Lrp/AsnC family transcriptional regulator, leucine-responsive regulatory protein